MTVPNGDEREIDTVTQRAALATYLLLQGWQPKTRQVAEKFGMSDGGAWNLMCRLSDVLPIAQDDEDRWHVTENGEQHHRHYVCTC